MSQKLCTKHVLYYCLSVLIIYIPFTVLATQIGKSDISYAKDTVDTPCLEMSQARPQNSNACVGAVKLNMPTQVEDIISSDSTVSEKKTYQNTTMARPQNSNACVGAVKLNIPTQVEDIISSDSTVSKKKPYQNTTMERNEHFVYVKDFKGMVNSWQENVLIGENPLPTHNDLNDISTEVENFDIKQDLSLTPNFKTESSTQGQTSLMQSDAISLSSDASSSIQNRTDHAEISDQVSISDKLDIDSKIDVSSPLKSISVNDIPSTPKRDYKESDGLPLLHQTPPKTIITSDLEQSQDQNSPKSINDLHNMDTFALFASSSVKSNDEVMSNSSMGVTGIKFDSMDILELDIDVPRVTLTDSSSDVESNDLNDISTEVENFDTKQDLSLTPNFKAVSSSQDKTPIMKGDVISLSSDASSSASNIANHAEISDNVLISDKSDIDSKMDVSSPLKSISVNDIPSTPKREYKESDTLPIFDYTPSKIIIAYNQEQSQDQNSSKSVNDLHDMDMPVLFALSPVKSNEEVMSNSSMDITRIKFDSVDTQNNKGCVKSESDMDSPKVTLADSSSDGESNELSEFSVMISECDDSERESIFDDTRFEGNVKSDKGKSELSILDTDRLVSDVSDSDVIHIEKKVKVIGGVIGKNYKLLNHLNFQEMYLDSGIHEGNGFSLNADKIETIKNSRILLDKLDCNASKMTVNEGSWVMFLDIKNNVKHLNLGEDSRVSFINHDKDIKIPRITSKEKGFGDVAINGGTINGIGKRDFPVKSVIFLGGENIIADSVYANNVKFEIVARVVSSNADTVIYSVNPFDGTLPQNWYLADANTLKPESGMAFFRAFTASEDRTDTQTASCSKSATVSASVNRTDETHISSHMEVTSDVAETKTATLPTSADILYAEDIDIEKNEKETSNACCKQEEARVLASKVYSDEDTSNMSMAQKKEAYDMATSLDGVLVGDGNSDLNANGAVLMNNVNDIITGVISTKIGERALLEIPTKNTPEEDAIGLSSGDEDSSHNYGVWLKGVYGTAKQGKTNKQASYDSSSYGFVIGADMEFNGLAVIGAAYSPMKTDLKYAKHNKGNKLSADSHIFSLYMRNYLNNEMSIKTILSGGISDIKSKRNIDARVVAIGKMTNKFYYVQSSVDYNIVCGDVNLIPQVGLKYTSFHDSSMKEKGAGLFNAIMKGKTYNELSAIGGMKVALHPRKLREGIILNSSLQAYVEQILKNSKYTKQIKFAWSDEYFKNEIYDQNKQSYNLGGNVGVVYKNFELSTGYNVYLRKKYKGHQVSLILNVTL